MKGEILVFDQHFGHVGWQLLSTILTGQGYALTVSGELNSHDAVVGEEFHCGGETVIPALFLQ